MIQKVPISDVALVNPRLPKDVDPAQKVSFLAMASVSESGKILDQGSRILEDTKKGFTYFERGDVILAKITPCFENGKAALLDGLETQIGFGSTEFHVLRPDPARLDAKYLFYLVWSDHFRFHGQNAMQGAAGQKRVSATYLKDFVIPLPPLSDQKRIATILDKADALRRKRQQAIELANQFLQSVFSEMFGDPVSNPHRWTECNLEDIISKPLQNGAYYPKSYYSDSGVEMVHMSDAFYDYINRGDLKRVLAPEKDIEKYALGQNDILISRRSLNLEGAAKPSLITACGEDLIFESSMIRLTPDLSKVLPKYLFTFLANPAVKAHRISQYITGATIKGISQKNLAKVRVLVPDIELQAKFVNLFERVEKIKNNGAKHVFDLDILFKSISKDVFRA